MANSLLRARIHSPVVVTFYVQQKSRFLRKTSSSSEFVCRRKERGHRQRVIVSRNQKYFTEFNYLMVFFECDGLTIRP